MSDVEPTRFRTSSSDRMTLFILATGNLAILEIESPSDPSASFSCLSQKAAMTGSSTGACSASAAGSDRDIDMVSEQPVESSAADYDQLKVRLIDAIKDFQREEDFFRGYPNKLVRALLKHPPVNN